MDYKQFIHWKSGLTPGQVQLGLAVLANKPGLWQQTRGSVWLKHGFSLRYEGGQFRALTGRSSLHISFESITDHDVLMLKPIFTDHRLTHVTLSRVTFDLNSNSAKLLAETLNTSNHVLERFCIAAASSADKGNSVLLKNLSLIKTRDIYLIHAKMNEGIVLQGLNRSLIPTQSYLKAIHFSEVAFLHKSFDLLTKGIEYSSHLTEVEVRDSRVSFGSFSMLVNRLPDRKGFSLALRGALASSAAHAVVLFIKRKQLSNDPLKALSLLSYDLDRVSIKLLIALSEENPFLWSTLISTGIVRGRFSIRDFQS